MAIESDKMVLEVICIATRILELADECEVGAEDDTCMLFGGELRDCGYRLRGRAIHERDVRVAAGVWREGVATSG